MDLISLILYLAIIGAIVWAVTVLVPMDEGFRRTIRIVALLIVLLWLLSLFAPFPTIPVGRR